MSPTRAYGKGVRLLLPVLAVLSLALAPLAQAASNVQGSISGQVITGDGDVVDNATVTITNLGTGFTREEAAEDGRFSFTSLPVGNYRVSASAPGLPDDVREPVAVNIGTGTSVTMVLGGDAAALERVTVSGAQITPIDVGSTEAATNFGEQTVDRIPVLRNLTAVALLAPGTTKGDSDFGNLASFGGATIGENVCYINGLNVTDFRTGLGCSSVPFEFYDQFQLKTGGYSAEFGRSTGGVINAVTKSGTNEFHYGANVYYEPFIEDISGAEPNVYLQNGELHIDNANDEFTSTEMNLWASGPILKDKLFFYVLYNPREDEAYNQESGVAVYDPATDAAYGYVSEQTDDSGFWGTKFDWRILNNHLIELTAFSDEKDIERNYYLFDDGSQGAFNSQRTYDRGGTNWSVKYTGYLTPDFTLSALYGENVRNQSTTVGNPGFPAITDYSGTFASAAVRYGSLAAGSISDAEDTREAMRVDAEWFLGDHQLSFGLDYETNTATENTYYSGGGNVNRLTGEPFPDFVGNVYRYYGPYYYDYIYYNPNSEFETKTSAFYVEDKWQVTNDVVLSLGLRNEAFENLNAAGEAFVDIDNQWAPRIGVSWDALGDGSLKVYGNYGRYYLPVATNTNLRLAGAEYYTLSLMTPVDANGDGVPDIDADGPVIGGELAPGYDPVVVYGSGTVKPTNQSVDQDIDPMYQDELIIGFMKDLGNNWAIGSRFIHRDLKSTLEDIAIDAAANAYAAENGYDNFQAYGFDYYVLTNPGTDVSVYMNFDTDVNGDGVVDYLDQGGSEMELVNFTAGQLGYPESERYYNAIELLFERAWDGEWFLQGSYTWSQSYGNNEGFVRSDNAQTDAGLTTLFDQPGLLDGAYGYLPNDRRHAFKMFGAWQFTDHWQAGFNLRMESGRPVNAFGWHPTDDFAQAYHSESFYQNGTLVPRGTRGSTAFTSSLDLSLKYLTTLGTSDVSLGVDLINAFNSVNVTEVDEVADETCTGTYGDEADPWTCDQNPAYGLPTAFQQPRIIRFTAEVTF